MLGLNRASFFIIEENTETICCLLPLHIELDKGGPTMTIKTISQSLQRFILVSIGIIFIWTTYPWIAFIPVFFFTLVMLGVKMMLMGLIRVMNSTSSSEITTNGYLHLNKNESVGDFEFVKKRESSLF